MKKLIILGVCLLSACSEAPISPLLYQVNLQSFAIEVPAEGELFAAKATIISAPVSRGGVQNISWLAPEFSIVKAGDIIARFDGEAMQVKSRNKENEMAITQQEIIEKTGMLYKELDAINRDIGMVEQERLFA